MKRLSILAACVLFSGITTLVRGATIFRVDPLPVMTTADTAPAGAYPALYAVAGANIGIFTDSAGTIPATTYTDITGVTACPVGAPVVQAGVGICSATAGPQGQFGFWLAAGTYYYRITTPYGGTFGPYPITINTLGVTQIIPGSGVSITPSSGLGAVTINATGSVPIVSTYNWGPVASASVLTGGNSFTLTLAPVPLGVNANSPSYSMSITGCSGGNQTVSITGGTAVSGASSGTVIFTPSVSCALGFAIGSASAGLQESICALPSAGGQVIINNTPTLLQNVNACNKTDVAVFKEAGSVVTGSFTILGSNISGLNGSVWIGNNSYITDAGIVFPALTGVLIGNGASPVTAQAQLSVGNGGTGDSTLAANGPLLGNGTGPIQTAAAGTADQVFVVPHAGPPGGFGQVDLSEAAAVKNALARANGGFGNTSPGTGIVRDGSPPAASELSGDATTSGNNTVTVVKVNGGAVPASAVALGSNSGNQLVAASVQGSGDTKVQLAGTNSGTTGAPLCNDTNGGSTTSGCALLPSGAQTQILHIEPNTGNNTTLQFTNPVSASIADYNFPAQTPGGTLTSGLMATITLTPVPLGVNAGNANYYIYISAGTGTAEPCLVTGGTASSGSSSGTLTCTPANNHSGAWTVTSATAGTQEAIDANCAGSVNCSIVVPAGIWTIYTPVVFMSSSSFLNASITLYGFGQSSQIVRGAGFTSGNMIWEGSPSSTNPGAFYSIHDLFLQTPNTLNVTGGAAIEVTGNSGGNDIHDVVIWNGYDGVILNACSAAIRRVQYLQQAQVVSNSIYSRSGIYLTSAASAGPSGVIISDSSFQAQNVSSATYSLNYGMLVGASDGVQISNSSFSGQDGILLGTNGVSDLNDVYMDNLIVDGVSGFGIAILGNTPAGKFVGNFRIADSHIYTYSSESSSQNGIDIAGLGGSPTNVILANNNIGGFQLDGVRIGAGATRVTMTGNSVMNNAATGLSLPSGVTGLTVTGNVFGNLSGQTPTQGKGIIIGQTLADANISHNDVSTSTSPYEIVTAGSISNSQFDGNIGFGTPGVASAASLQLPIAPTFTLTGTTGVTSVNVPFAVGTRFSFVATAGSPGAWSSGATIANTFTPTQNVPVDCIVLAGPQVACHP